MIDAAPLPAAVAEGRGPLALLGDAVQAVAAEPCDGLDLPALREELEELRRQIDLLEAEFVRRVGYVDRMREFFPDEPGSLVGWLRTACRLSGAAAAERVEVSRQLAHLPQTEEALVRGSIGYEHARVIARTATDLGREAAQVAEPALLATAQQADPNRLREIAQEVCHAIDPEGALEAARRQWERRRVRLSKSPDGAFGLEGLLDAEGGATLTTALNALMAPVPGDARTTIQRRADALVELARRQLQGGELPLVAGQRPHLTVTVSADGLALAREGGGDRSAVPRLGWAGAIPTETARRVACDASLTPMVVDEHGSPLDVGRTTRTISPGLRRALVARDRGCRFPGCDRPPEWTTGHHLVHWADGGPTRLDNLLLLCQRCHTFVHEQGWKLRWEEGGELIAEPP